MAELKLRRCREGSRMRRGNSDGRQWLRRRWRGRAISREWRGKRGRGEGVCAGIGKKQLTGLRQLIDKLHAPTTSKSDSNRVEQENKTEKRAGGRCGWIKKRAQTTQRQWHRWDAMRWALMKSMKAKGSNSKRLPLYCSFGGPFWLFNRRVEAQSVARWTMQKSIG